jgi:death-on-curing protein
VKEPRFLTRGQINKLHARSIAQYGGATGVRDEGGLDAAINQPKNVNFYGGGDLFDLAAAYAFHIAEGQCFLDGNKRTAAGAALVFLRINGVELQFGEREIYYLLMGIAEHKATKADLAEYLRNSATR